LINANDDIKMTYDSLEASDNGKPGDSCNGNNLAKEVSAKPADNTKSLLTVTNDDIAICPDKESSFENEKWSGNAADC
jgi:hypothetical protein